MPEFRNSKPCGRDFDHAAQWHVPVKFQSGARQFIAGLVHHRAHGNDLVDAGQHRDETTHVAVDAGAQPREPGAAHPGA